jgi:hypothetical protein
LFALAVDAEPKRQFAQARYAGVSIDSAIVTIVRRKYPP